MGSREKNQTCVCVCAYVYCLVCVNESRRKLARPGGSVVAAAAVGTHKFIPLAQLKKGNG